MAVNRVILQQFSMQLNYLNNKERSNIYQPSAKQQQKPTSEENAGAPMRQLSSSDDDCCFDKCSESSFSSQQPTSPSEQSQSSDEDIQTILDNVLISSNPPSVNNPIISKCEDATPCAQMMNASPLQSRRRQQRSLFIVCPTPSG